MNELQIQQFKEALVFSPNNLILRKLLADALLNLARYEEAEQEYKLILQQEEQNNEVKHNLAKAYYGMKKFAAAKFLLEEQIAQQNATAEQLHLLAKICFASGATLDAQRHFEAAKNINNQLIDNDLESQIKDKMINEGHVLTHSHDDIDDLLLALDIEKPDIGFDAVGGMKAIKEEIALKIIHPLKNPEIYKAYGKKIGGGILLYGPPGCGKTLMARATAGEINAKFIAVSINDVLDMYIGNSEKNLNDIFQQARANTPCVLFFDEVDALGASRSDLRKSAGRFQINQFLDELDGAKFSNDGILILGATNSPWYLDSAFRRPGRFDRVILVSPPDLEARAEILKIQLEGKPYENIDFQQLAKATEGFSGADLKAMIDIAIEQKIPESIAKGQIIPINNNDVKIAVQRVKPSTKEWFATAKNYALYSNESGLYDDILKYMNIKK